jgi:hypothetical protein
MKTTPKTTDQVLQIDLEREYSWGILQSLRTLLLKINLTTTINRTRSTGILDLGLDSLNLDPISGSSKVALLNLDQQETVLMLMVG